MYTEKKSHVIRTENDAFWTLFFSKIENIEFEDFDVNSGAIFSERKWSISIL